MAKYEQSSDDWAVYPTQITNGSFEEGILDGRGYLGGFNEDDITSLEVHLMGS